MQSHMKAAENEIEIGYWIRVPFWDALLCGAVIMREMKNQSVVRRKVDLYIIIQKKTNHVYQW